MDVSRRSLARILAAASVAQATAASQDSATAVADEDLRTAREQMQNNARLIAKVNLPMAVEPATHFKA